MGLFESRETNKDSVISSIGQTIINTVRIPFDFTEKLVKTPFDFVSSTVSGITTKVVLIVGLGILGIFLIAKYNLIGQVGKLK